MASAAMTVRVEIDDAALLRALREQRRQINQDVKKVTLAAAEREVLPEARRRAPGFASRHLIAKSTTRGAYLSTSARGMLRRTIGLLEYGGTVTTPITHKRARALKLGPDWFAARVTTPRTYAAKRFMRGAVDARFNAFVGEVGTQMTRIMRSRLEYTRTFR